MNSGNLYRAGARLHPVRPDRGARRAATSNSRPEHLLKVLLDDPEGLAAGLIERAGGDSRDALAATERALDGACPRSPAAAPASSISRQPTAKVFETAEKIAKKAGDSFVTVERLLLALAMEKDAKTAKILADAGVTPQTLNAAIEEIRKGRTADSRLGREPVRRAEEIRPRPHRRRPRGQARPGDRPRRGNPPHHPGAGAAHQEQPGADRRARRRQDGDRRGPGATASSTATCRRASRTSSCWRSTWAR